MTHRIIHFKQQALLDPETYQAMLADGVGHWERLAGEVVGIEDEKSHEFAALKSLFKRKRYSYDTLEMREPGDHSNWLRGRDGSEGMTNEVTSIPGLKSSQNWRFSGIAGQRSSADLGRIAKLLDEFADRFGTFCALNGDLAGRSIHFYSCILIQSLNGLRDFAHATATAHPRNTQTKHVFHLISSAAQVTARTASTLTRWQGQARMCCDR